MRSILWNASEHTIFVTYNVRQNSSKAAKADQLSFPKRRSYEEVEATAEVNETLYIHLELPHQQKIRNPRPQCAFSSGTFKLDMDPGTWDRSDGMDTSSSHITVNIQFDPEHSKQTRTMK